MFSYLASNIIYNEIEYFLYVNIWIIGLFVVLLYYFIFINSCLLIINTIKPNINTIELSITLLSILVLLFLISPALIILLDYDSINIPTIILYSIGYQWAWNFNIYFSSLFNTYIDQRIVPFSFTQENIRLLINNSILLFPLYSIMKFWLFSYDVIHSLSYYSLGIKIDAIPARVNASMSIRPLIRGEYRGFCFELCGQGHSVMLLSSFVLRLI